MSSISFATLTHKRGWRKIFSFHDVPSNKPSSKSKLTKQIITKWTPLISIRQTWKELNKRKR